MALTIQGILDIGMPSECKLHAARWNGERNPLDVFTRDRAEWIEWNTWRGTRNEFNRKLIVSFIDFYPERWIWLFGGMFQVTSRGAPHGHTYEIEELPNGKDLIGRLKVHLELGRGRAFRLENVIDHIMVTEVLKEAYTGEAFTGYDNVSLDFAMLEALVANQRLDWKTALESVKGVYLIADRKTGKKYVGSAYGDTGVWSRWSHYAVSGHGNNSQLVALMAQPGISYARENFRITLLEPWPYRTEDSVIIRRESFWKEALLTRGDWGYNNN